MIHNSCAKKTFLLALLVCATYALKAQDDSEFWKYGKASFPLFKELLAIPNDAHFHDDIEKNVQWCEVHFQKRGFTTKRLETETVPLLLAERKSDNTNAKTVLIYLQVDGQPVDPNHWFQDNPYEAVLKQRAEDGGWEMIDWSNLESGEVDSEWRIFARSTSDAKGPVAAFLTVVDMMAAKSERSDFHTKIIMDFEEELGSPQLPDAVVNYRDQLKADMLVIFDGPSASSTN